VDDEVGALGSVIFQVFVDDTKVLETPLMTGNDGPKPIEINVEGKNELKLIVLPGEGIGYDHADWADARLLNGSGVGIPSASTELTAVPGNQQVMLSWSAAAGAASYNVRRTRRREQNVITFTESEFGRTGNPSATNGSDHAWGSHHFAVGAPVKGGSAYGTFPTLQLQGPDDVSNRGVWLPSTSLDQYAATMASWFGVPDASLATVFPNLPNFTTQKLGFI
jgi:hypothetical protein